MTVKESEADSLSDLDVIIKKIHYEIDIAYLYIN